VTTRLERAVIDYSAVLCIALGEPAAARFLDGLARTDRLYIGAAYHHKCEHEAQT
jgi:uncharacterized protein with PIN domain